MLKSADNKKFFLNTIKALGASKGIRTNSRELLKILLKFDPLKLTKFEFSFKVKGGKISKEARFLNMDANVYSCRKNKFFMSRVKLFEKILERKCKNKEYKKVISALKEISKTPTDLYFGFDVKNKEYLFAFWLIFGGVKRSGKVSFWPYDFNKIIDSSLRTIGLKKHKLLKKDILNLGFDIGKDCLRYKVYYLCREKVMQDSVFTELMKDINSNLSGFKYFYFFSEMYDEKGDLVKEKLFVEFLEDVLNKDKKRINSILQNILKVNGVKFDVNGVSSILKNCGGRISLISFEQDGTLTFYIRPTDIVEAP